MKDHYAKALQEQKQRHKVGTPSAKNKAKPSKREQDNQRKIAELRCKG